MPIHRYVVAAPLHTDELRRLAALERLGILDTPAEERFDRLTRIAAAVLDVPMSLVTVVAEDRQWFKSQVGIDGTGTSRDEAFCAHAIVQPDDLLVVPDATLDPRFADNPMVLGDDHIRFYAGHVVREATGLPIGALCVVDRVPRELSERDRAVLRDLAAMAEEELARGSHHDALAELAESEHRLSLIVRSLNEGWSCRTPRGTSRSGTRQRSTCSASPPTSWSAARRPTHGGASFTRTARPWRCRSTRRSRRRGPATPCRTGG